MRAITLTGSNSFLIERFIQERLLKFKKDFGDIGIERLDGEEERADDVLAKIGSTCLFTDNRLMILKGISKNSLLADKIDSLLGQSLEGLELIIVEPKLDKRSKLYRVLKAKTDFKEQGELSSPALVEWLVNEAIANGCKLGHADAKYLIERVGVNQLILAQELNKLLLFGNIIDRDMIDWLVEATPQSDTFELVEATLARDYARVVELYQEQRALKVDPRLIIGLLTWQLHLLATVKTSATKSPSQVASDLGTYPSVINRTARIARRISYDELSQAIKLLLSIDHKSKKQTVNQDDVLLYYLLSF